MTAFEVSKLEKAFVNYVLDAGLLDKEEVRRLCIAKKKMNGLGKTKEAHLAQLAIKANYITKEQAQEILSAVKLEMQETIPEKYEQEIDHTLSLYGVDLEKIILEPKKDFSTPEERYEKIDEIGRGAMGIVDKVWDNMLKREVAKKTILLTEKAQGDPEKLKAEVIRRTQRAKNEARLTGRLKHPYIMKVFDSGRDKDDNFFHVMEYVENGKELADIIGQIAETRRKGMRLERFALDNMLEMAAKICDAMDYAHKQGIIHRDLKPANIMTYGPENAFVFVADFGLAKDINRRELVLKGTASDEDLTEAKLGKSQEIRTEEGQVMGTLKYMAPEQAGGAEKADTKSDIFALGAILYELLTGQAARDFQGKDITQALMAVAREKIPDAREAKDTLYPITKELAAICAKAMALEPKKRYKTAGQMARDIRNYVEHKELIACPDGIFTRLYKKALRNPGKAGMTIAAAILLPLAAGGIGVVRGISALNELRLEQDKTTAERKAKEEAEGKAKAEKGRADAETKAKTEAEGRAEAEKGRADLAERLVNVHKDKAEALILNNDAMQKIDYARNIRAKDKREQVLQAAVSVLEKAKSLDDRCAPIFHNLGVISEILGQPDAASQQYGQALAIDPNYGKARFGRATIRLQKGDVNGAIEDYEKAKETLPLVAILYSNLGVCYIRKGNNSKQSGNTFEAKEYFRKAIQNCDAALEINEQYGMAHRNKGESFMYLGEHKTAEQSLTNAVTYGNIYSHLLLARNMIEATNSGNPLYPDWKERAKDHCARAVSIDESLAEEAKEILEKIK